MMMFEKKCKLAARYINLCEIVEKVRKVAYRFVLPMSIKCAYKVFHVLSLHKYISDHSHVLRIKDEQLSKDLSYKERLVQILDKRIKQLRINKFP